MCVRGNYEQRQYEEKAGKRSWVDRLPDWFYPVAFFGIAILICAALWAVGDGRTPESYRSEVSAARELLVEQKKVLPPGQEASVESALDSLDPKAIAEAEG